MEPPTTTRLFTFVDNQEGFTHERIEIFLSPFEDLRRNLYKLILGLTESGDHDEEAIAWRLRNTLCELLTAPIAFDGNLAVQLSEFGDSAGLTDRWGADLQGHHERALALAQLLQETENPIREAFCHTVHEALSTGSAFKIYCSRHDETQCREALCGGGMELTEKELFIRSAAEYRNSELFDTLIKIGPLRSKGWGYAPHSIKSAPRFKRLVQIVWGGLKDECDFGYDPVASGFGATVIPTFISWRTRQDKVGEPSKPDIVLPAVEDELDLLSKLSEQKLGQPRRCLKLSVTDELAIAFLPGATLLAIDPEDVSPAAIDYRRARDFKVGFYLIRHVFTEDVDLGAPACSHGHYSLTWKMRLRNARASDPDGLIRKLRASGLGLEHLAAAIRNWCKPAGAVIPAPQQMRHFRILMKVLELDGDSESSREAMWRKAWAEISRSRGNASEAGRQREDIVDAELLAAAKETGQSIRTLCREHEDFSYPIPGGRGLSGHFLCSRVYAIESPFLVPQSEVGKTLPKVEFEQWRV
jgi:hypothetical protein